VRNGRPILDRMQLPARAPTPRLLVPEIPVEELHSHLGIETALDYPDESLAKPLANWKMEVDDAPIFRYLYRHLRPRRHLEFGTWQGTGTLFCLEECEATVWTINLLEGEVRPDQSWGYTEWKGTAASHAFQWLRKRTRWLPAGLRGKVRAPPGMFVYRSDSIGSVGENYIKAGLGKRVCQIYSDSRDWDISNYPTGFFDTVLIDGGHSADVVVSDTGKALQLARSGGIILWHDFCPRPEAHRPDSAGIGVLRAIETLWPRINSEMREVFWIRPSWILLGIKR